jgi:hypothetical protein
MLRKFKRDPGAMSCPAPHTVTVSGAFTLLCVLLKMPMAISATIKTNIKVATEFIFRRGGGLSLERSLNKD